MNSDTQDFYGYEHFYREPNVAEKVNGQDKDTEGVLRLKTEYVAELEATIEKLDIEKEKTAKQKAVNDKQKAIKDEKIQELKYQLRDTHRLKNRILDREQTIRYHQANDRAVWLMIKDRQDKAEGHIDKTDERLNLDLKNLKLANIDAVLNEFVEVKGKVPRINPIVVGELPRAEVKIVEQLPIRRYGDLRRILKDRRLENLVVYYFPPQEEDMTKERPIREIAHETIKKELERYDLRREKFFATIYAFERDVYTWFKDEFDSQILSSTGFYDHNVFMEIATNHLTDTETAEHYKNNVKNLRNKFLHNEIPYFPWLTNEVQDNDKPYMCDKIFDVAEAYYTNLLRQIKPRKVEYQM